MCGIAAVCGPGSTEQALHAMVAAQRHRGPDDEGIHMDPAGALGLGHTRLSIIDLSSAGHQPMASADGTLWIAFNGELYNYLELRAELDDYPFRSRTDTEVVLAAWQRWGERCLDRFVGMFAFAIWDASSRELVAVRDRFGVKPLYLRRTRDGGLLASELQALHAAGVPRRPDETTWATYLASGLYDHTPRTFWEGVEQVAPGGLVRWSPSDGWRDATWYDPAEAVLARGVDERGATEVADEALALLQESVRLRFRSDVPVGICLSGGLDSSLLLALVTELRGPDSDVGTFTFYCGDPEYDETPWVEKMLGHTHYPWHRARLDAADVPALAARMQFHQGEPFGGMPTLGMGRVHETAHEHGVTVLLDGNGLDEGWAGYDYYQRAAEVDASRGPVQGSKSSAVGSGCLVPGFGGLAEPFEAPTPFGDPLRDLQLRDLRCAKIPRATRFSDRAAMMWSREGREPFLDHRLIELGLRQPAEHKLRNGSGKWLMRQVAKDLVPADLSFAPKRPVQTPQREWLRGPLASWADGQIERALAGWGRDWLDGAEVRKAWRHYREVGADNSFPVWQWVNLGLMQ